MQSVINGPLEVTALNQGSLALTRNRQGLLDSRYQQLRTQDNDSGTFGMFGGYAGQSADSKFNPSLGLGDGDLTNQLAEYRHGLPTDRTLDDGSDALRR